MKRKYYLFTTALLTTLSVLCVLGQSVQAAPFGVPSQPSLQGTISNSFEFSERAISDILTKEGIEASPENIAKTGRALRKFRDYSIKNEEMGNFFDPNSSQVQGLVARLAVIDIPLNLGTMEAVKVLTEVFVPATAKNVRATQAGLKALRAGIYDPTGEGYYDFRIQAYRAAIARLADSELSYEGPNIEASVALTEEGLKTTNKNVPQVVSGLKTLRDGIENANGENFDPKALVNQRAVALLATAGMPVEGLSLDAARFIPEFDGIAITPDHIDAIKDALKKLRNAKIPSSTINPRGIGSPIAGEPLLGDFETERATARVASIAYLVRRAKELNPQLDLIEPPLDGLTIQGARHLELEPDYYPIDVKTPAPDPEVVALLSKVNGDVRMNSWRSLDTLWATPGYFGTGNFNNVIGLKNLVSQSWYAARKASGKLGADAAADATRTNYLSLLHNAASSVLSSPVGIPTPIDTLSQGRLKNPDALPDADMQGFTITKLAIQLKQVAKDEEGRDGRDRNLRRALKMSEMSEALHLRATESKARHALK